jgi:hypothetical protein
MVSGTDSLLALIPFLGIDFWLLGFNTVPDTDFFELGVGSRRHNPLANGRCLPVATANCSNSKFKKNMA